MNKKKLISLSIMLILLSLYISIEVKSLGIAPSKKFFDYNNQDINLSIRIVNTEQKNTTLTLSSGGPLSEFTTINGGSTTIEISEYTSEVIIPYTISLPENHDPQKNTLYISATEISSDNQGTIGGLLSVTHQLIVNIPYGSEYITSQIDINSEDGKGISKLIILNKGTTDTTYLRIKMQIIDKNKEVLFTKNNIEIPNLKSGESKEIITPFEFNRDGKFFVKYYIFDENGKEIIIEKEFENGNKIIELENIIVDNFKLGTIAKFDIELKNYWNDEISNTYTEITITNSDNKTLGTYKTEKTTLTNENEYVTAYWDTTNISPGLYNMKVTLYTEDTSFTKEYLVNVDYNNIIVKDTKSKIDNQMILGITLILLSLLIFSIVLVHGNKKLYK